MYEGPACLSLGCRLVRFVTGICADDCLVAGDFVTPADLGLPTAGLTGFAAAGRVGFTDLRACALSCSGVYDFWHFVHTRFPEGEKINTCVGHRGQYCGFMAGARE